MRKFILTSALVLASAGSAVAGGYLTNTNQSVSYLRNPARLATFSLDGAYSNPAGLAWIGEGWHISFTGQNAAQDRDILSTYDFFAGNVNQLGNNTKLFHGEASAPFIPSLDAAYQKGPWTVSMHFGITGGGGKATFNSGLPMFESQVAVLPTLLAGKGLNADAYDCDMYMQGRQYIYGIQLGLTYKIFENYGALKQGLSAHLGARMNFASNHYEGYLRNISARLNGQMVGLNGYFAQQSAHYTDLAGQANGAATQFEALAGTTTDPAQAEIYRQQAEAYRQQAAQAEGAATQFNALAAQTADMELNCDQKGWGVAPIIGLDYRIGHLNLGARYEFQTSMNIENKTKINTTGIASFQHGVNTPNDIPALLSIGAQYDITPKWRVMAGWNTYFDKKAGMAGHKEKTLRHNTHEITAGMEYDILDRLTISGGYQNTDYGTSDAFQSDLSFICDSYSLGFGLKVGITSKCNIEAAYFWTTYKDYKKETEHVLDPARPDATTFTQTDIYSRTNKVFGLGVTYNF